MTWRPMRGFRVGAMRERINIQTATDSVDDAGQPIRSWANTYANEPACWEPISGQETLRGRQVEAGITTIFYTHYRSSVVPQMRVVHNSVNYGIVYVKPIEGGRRYLELQCKAVT